MHFHKYSLQELDNLIPWEKEIYCMLLLQHLEKEKMHLQEKQRNRK
jgi:hypothetical protein